jgi:type VI secretion system secreted protein Hcp
MAGYLKIGDIKGQAADADHKDWIELLSVGQVVRRPMSAGAGGQAGRQQGTTELHDIQVTKRLDKSTPKLLEAVCDGKPFDEVEIHLCTAEGAKGRKPYYKLKLKHVIVSDHALTASTEGASADMESLALNFTEIEWCYTSFKPNGQADGDVKATWKVGPGTA